MRFLPRFIYSSGIILRGARGDKYRTVTFRNSLATRDAGSAGGVNRGAGEPPGPGPSAGPRRPRRVATSSPRRARRSGVQRTRLSAFPPGPADDARLPAPPGHAHRDRLDAPAPERRDRLDEYEDRPRRTAPSSVVSLFVLYTHYGGRYHSTRNQATRIMAKIPRVSPAFPNHSLRSPEGY